MRQPRRPGWRRDCRVSDLCVTDPLRRDRGTRHVRGRSVTARYDEDGSVDSKKADVGDFAVVKPEKITEQPADSANPAQ